MFDKYKNFYQNEKSLKDKYYKMRIGIFETYELDPNKTIYNLIVNFPSFLFINTISSYYLIKKHRINLKNIFGTKLKLLGQLTILTFFNYNMFNRSYLNDYPANNKFYIDNKFNRLSNSLVNPVFVMEKDFLILLMIFIPCLVFNKNKVDDMNKIKKEKIKAEEENYKNKNNIVDDKVLEEKVLSVPLKLEKVKSAEEPILAQAITEDSSKYVRSGKFL